jgi:hypothetical protein
MLLRRECRDRAVGLIGAYAVLLAGVVFSGALDPPPAKSDLPSREASLEPAKSKGTDVCTSALECRSGTFC